MKSVYKPKVLDVVRTRGGEIGVVDKIGTPRTSFSIVLHPIAVGKYAWYAPSDGVEYLFNVGEMVEALDTDTIKELIRLRKGE